MSNNSVFVLFTIWLHSHGGCIIIKKIVTIDLYAHDLLKKIGCFGEKFNKILVAFVL